MGPPRINDDAVALRVLARLLRARPRTLTELRGIRNVPDEGLEEILDRLVAAGFVAVDGEHLEVRRPDHVLEAQAAALAGLTALLPALSDEWQRGAAPESRLDVELVHEHEEQWRAWARYAAIAPPRATENSPPT